jgi:hypothetical protein
VKLAAPVVNDKGDYQIAWGATWGANNKMIEKAVQELKDLATMSRLSIAVSC